MVKPEENLRNLKDFVEHHDLQDRFSNIFFNALVTIKTATNKVTNQHMEVRISFDGYDSYGAVTLMKSDLDTNLYPTIFEAKWNQMEHVDDEYLSISDTHKMNPKIGKYLVKIIPLDILKP